jgi:hypothetical protein
MTHNNWPPLATIGNRRDYIIPIHYTDGLEWAQKLADQEWIAKNESSIDKVLSFYHEFKHETYSWYMNNRRQCGWQAVISSYDPVDNRTTSVTDWCVGFTSCANWPQKGTMLSPQTKPYATI